MSIKRSIANLFFSMCRSAVALLLLWACKNEPSPPLSPDKALATFYLADDNLHIELVASEPLVQDPVAISFDEAGRLWVVEMLGFMKDIDGTGETDKVGRISVLFDDDGDGQMDRSIVFLDSLVLPRAIAVVGGGVLVAENIPLWFVEDTNGDFIADTKTLIDPEYGGLGLPEHSANGLLRGMDNWYYNAKSKWRYRRKGAEWVKEETEARGQWGISQDNAGRLFYNYNWSQLHGDLVPPNSLNQNPHHTSFSGIDHGLTLERRLFPVRSSPAVNRGYIPGTFDDEGKLLEFTAACAPLVYRGTALPETFQGDVFVCEPTSNLIRQNKIIAEGFMLSAQNPYPEQEFLASTDERLRPVNLASGPDGALYVVDMYKGIIQHAPYMTPYLREVTFRRKLEAPIHMGRIWKISSKGKQRSKASNLSSLSPNALVALLGDANGWTRDMAQRLLVEKNDASVLPLLGSMISEGSPLGQLHALWTLEGMGYSDPVPYLNALSAQDDKVVQAALRLLVALVPEQPQLQRNLTQFIQDHYEHSSPLVQMQMVLAGQALHTADALPFALKFLETYGDFPVSRDVVLSSLEHRELQMLHYSISREGWQTYDQKRELYFELLAAAIANSASETTIKEVLYLLENKENGVAPWIKTALIHGMVTSKAANTGMEIALDKPPLFFSHPEILGTAMAPVVLQFQELFTWQGKPQPAASDIKKPDFELDPNVMAAGRQNYSNLCASCHGTQGEGMARFAPPLQQSEWVTGAGYKLGMILLHGIEGPIVVNGKTYTIPDILPSMPSFATLQDKDIAAIATYIRNSWGNAAPPLSTRDIGGIRVRNQGKVTPWSPTQLDTLVYDAAR